MGALTANQLNNVADKIRQFEDDPASVRVEHATLDVEGVSVEIGRNEDDNVALVWDDV